MAAQVCEVEVELLPNFELLPLHLCIGGGQMRHDVRAISAPSHIRGEAILQQYGRLATLQTESVNVLGLLRSLAVLRAKPTSVQQPSLLCKLLAAVLHKEIVEHGQAGIWGKQISQSLSPYPDWSLRFVGWLLCRSRDVAAVLLPALEALKCGRPPRYSDALLALVLYLDNLRDHAPKHRQQVQRVTVAKSSGQGLDSHPMLTHVRRRTKHFQRSASVHLNLAVVVLYEKLRNNLLRRLLHRYMPGGGLLLRDVNAAEGAFQRGLSDTLPVTSC